MLNKKKATKNDYKLVLDIWEKSAKKTHHFLSDEDFNFYKKIIPEHLDYVNLYLWEDNDEIIGFSGISEDELVMLFLDPDFIGKRYGSKILIELMEMENINKIDVNTQNEYAKNFYLNHGFEIESEDEVDGFGKPYPITHLIKTIKTDIF
ncbi:GNAT family N-acetyltransferase [Vagococcus vulneris]|uniref:GNAT family N-acetyltransferase n=1 Tax=Vagococcus vulneris TaxID=1977869 RepID=A0A429ZXD1_9ENTE|nr:GNAT family N-acetyltransferase [Vagococcus vulneris]RST98533.1 GNAT family N-acetyltransferase [Vagococcus vulneris]